ncbi:MAG: phage DNA packaging protein J [Tannerella sp.]|nr:phage DNA packaging protein J [Tannerella sp.]
MKGNKRSGCRPCRKNPFIHG